MRASTRIAIVAISCIGMGCPSTAPRRPAPPPNAKAPSEPSSTPAPPPQPTRAYVKGAHAHAVVDEVGPFRSAAVSPDGLLMALVPIERTSVLFYDIDRQRIVGRAPGGPALGGGEATWFGDDVLLVSTGDTEAAYDGRSGALLGRVKGGIAGAVARSDGLAVLRTAGSGDAAELVLFAEPERILAKVAVDGYIRRVIDLGDGAFACHASQGVFAFEADGKPRWSRAGDFAGVELAGVAPRALHVMSANRWTVLSPVDGHELASLAARSVFPTAQGGVYADGTHLYQRSLAKAAPKRISLGAAAGEAMFDVRGVSPGGRYLAIGDIGRPTLIHDFLTGTTSAFGGDVPLTVAWAPNDAPRVALGPEAVFDARSGSKSRAPLVTLGYMPRNAKVVHAGGASFAARCDNGATAILGPPLALPTSLADNPEPGDEGELVSSDGTYRVSWNGEDLRVTRIGDASKRVLDPGGPIVHAELHPNGTSVVTAAHFMYVGNGHIPDPNASVRVFDLKSGALVKRIYGDDFHFSPSGRRLIVLSHDGAAAHDATTYRKLRAWPGLDNDVWLDPTDHLALVYLREAPMGFGPIETMDAFVEAIDSRRRIAGFDRSEGRFAFDSKGSRLAYAAEPYPYSRAIYTVALYDLQKGIATETLALDEPVTQLAFLGDDRVLAIWTAQRLVLHRLDGHIDGGEVDVHAVPDGQACRLFAVDHAGHFQGDPGTKLAFRYGEDLRTSALATNGDELAVHRDDGIIERLLSP